MFKQAIAILVIGLTLFSSEVFSQGCVAIRGLSSCSGNMTNNVALSRGELFAGVGYRYFKSFRHFRGTTQEKHRIADGTQVINHSNFLDVSMSYGITNRLYANAVVPFVFHRRSSMYEHGGNPPNGLGERHVTSSEGLADIRLGIGYWLIDPEKVKNHNYAIGVGIKFNTGNYSYTDKFYNQGSEKNEVREAVVDQSIQPGDGGTGVALDFQSYHMISHHFILSSNFFYLINARETNGVLTRNGNSEFSSPDQFAVRIGTFYNTKIMGLAFYLGSRLEGVPSSDLIGGSGGYRRPGYVLSIEPGVSYSRDRYSLNLGLPVALIRNRTQSYLDKQRTKETGDYTHGDAAFADYVLNLTFSYRFGGHSTHSDLNVPKWNDSAEGFEKIQL